MRIIFMGSPEFAVPALNALVEGGHEVGAVYCQPPRPAGRGKADRKTAVHERAEQLGLEVRTPRTLRDADEQAKFAALGADLAVVAAYGLILPKPILDAPKMGCVNIHASLLPRWRGAAPIQRAILAGDPVSGVTIMQMDVGLDTGPMLLTRKIMLDRKNAAQVTEEIANIGADALIEWMSDPTSYRPQPQPAQGATYAPKIDRAETRIDWGRPAAEIERQIRAFAPAPGGWFEVNGERIKLLDAVAGNDASGRPGQVLDDCLNIASSQGYIRPLKVQRAGKSVMSPGEMLRGFPIPKGTLLS
jgi:methionyl-tRNA formyltransferase